jgi:hypothetical protein
VFRVRDGIADAIFQKDFEHSTCFFINQTTDTFHTTTTGETTNGRFGNALNVIAQDFAVTLGAALAELIKPKTSESMKSIALVNGMVKGRLCGDRLELTPLPPFPRPDMIDVGVGFVDE